MIAQDLFSHATPNVSCFIDATEHKSSRSHLAPVMLSPYRFSIPNQTPEQRQYLKTQIGILGISFSIPGIGEPEARKQKSNLASIEVLGSTFSSGIVVLGDFLSRFTFMLAGHPYEEAQKLARKAGQDWVRDYGAFVAEQPIPVRIIPWNFWLNMPQFPEKKAMVDRMYEENKLFRETIVENNDQFYARIREHCEASEDIKIRLSVEEMEKICERYKLEETAVFWMLGEFFNSKFMLYRNEVPEMITGPIKTLRMQKIKSLSTKTIAAREQLEELATS